MGLLVSTADVLLQFHMHVRRIANLGELRFEHNKMVRELLRVYSDEYVDIYTKHTIQIVILIVSVSAATNLAQCLS